MNLAEMGSLFTDLFYGKKVEGKIAAVLPSDNPSFSRYVVDTETELVDVQVTDIENHGPIIRAEGYTYHPPLSRGQKISRRSFNIKPWIDGQTIFLGQEDKRKYF